MGPEQFVERCANCDRTIGRLETPWVHKNHVVCAECHQRLNPVIEYASIAEPQSVQVQPMLKACPVCGSVRQPGRKSKGSIIIAILLLLLWIIPGLIYMVVYSGYVYVCPDCGYKYGDAV